MTKVKSQKLKVKSEFEKNRIIIINQLSKELELTAGDQDNLIVVVVISNGLNQEGILRIIIQRNSNVQILGIIIGSGKQQITLHTIQDHLQGENKSNLFIKSILFDEAKFSYQGLIKIAKDAQKSDAYQKNQNLLLSDKARVLTSPNLEILANDVRCTHGSTTGKLDEDQLSYLFSRGLDKKEATKLLLGGFFQEILSEIPDNKLRIGLEREIDRKMNELILC